MKSALPKVLHQIAGLPMVAHVVKAAEAAGAGDQALVIGHGADEMRKAAAKFAPKAETFVQEKRLGTAHAVLAARDAISRGYDDVLVMFGDTPLIDAGRADRGAAEAGRRCWRRGHRFPHGQSDRLWPTDRKGRQAGRHPRGEGLLRRGEKDRLLQWRPDGGGRQPCAEAARSGRQQERQGRILPDRYRRDRQRRKGSMSSPPRPVSRTRSASTTAPNWPKPKASGSGAGGARRCCPA